MKIDQALKTFLIILAYALAGWIVIATAVVLISVGARAETAPHGKQPESLLRASMCQAIAEDAHTLAELRDSGLAERDYLVNVLTQIREAQKAGETYVKTDADTAGFLQFALTIYRSTMTKSEIAEEAFVSCMESAWKNEMGGKVRSRFHLTT